MPRGKKSAAPRPGGLDRDVFHSFVRKVKDAKQDLDDANMAHAAEWKNADKIGIHAQAAKLYVRLDKMEPLKRADWLRSFDQMRGWSDWDAQQDIIDQAEANLAADIGEPESDDGRDPSEEKDREDAQHAVREPGDPEPQVEAEGDDPEATADQNAELAMAGHVFADGKQAATGGLGAEANPHPNDSPSHPIWARGHAQGLRDKEIAETVPADIVPKRGRRAAAVEAPAEDAAEVETVH